MTSPSMLSCAILTATVALNSVSASQEMTLQNERPGPLLTSPVPHESAFPDRMIVVGTVLDGQFLPQSISLPPPQEKRNDDGEALPIGRNLLPTVTLKSFGNHGRAAHEMGTQLHLRCLEGVDPAGVLLTLPGHFPAGADLELVVEADGGGDMRLFADFESNPDDLVMVPARATKHFPVPAGRTRGSQELVIYCPEEGAEITVRSVRLKALRRSDQSTSNGTWIWRTDNWLKNPDRLVATLKNNQMQRVFLQLPILSGTVSDRGLVSLMSKIRLAGIEVHAVEGDPEMVSREGLENALARAKIIRTFRDEHPDLITGIQYDIEPYTRQEHSADPMKGWTRWAESMKHLSRAHGDRVSVVVPFWMLDDEAGLTSMGAVLDVLKDATVMVYRTNSEVIERLAQPWLHWGKEKNVPVRIALENGSLPVERHVTYMRAESGDLTVQKDKYATVAQLWASRQRYEDRVAAYAYSHHVDVHPERVSFMGDLESLDTVRQKLARTFAAWSSFDGLTIHGLINHHER